MACYIYSEKERIKVPQYEKQTIYDETYDTDKYNSLN